jgi:VanZ family protein
MSVPELELARREAGPQLHLARLWWGLGWGMVLFILGSTLSPARYVPDLHLWDKAEHAIAFFGLTFWFGGLLGRQRYPALAGAMLVLGGGIEIAQGAMNWGRDEDILDFVADSVGVSVALTLLYLGLGAWAQWVERLLWPARESP